MAILNFVANKEVHVISIISHLVINLNNLYSDIWLLDLRNIQVWFDPVRKWADPVKKKNTSLIVKKCFL